MAKILLINKEGVVNETHLPDRSITLQARESVEITEEEKAYFENELGFISYLKVIEQGGPAPPAPKGNKFDKEGDKK